MIPPRTAILRAAAALLAALVLGTLLLLVHPVLITGRYYDLTVRDLDYGPQGLLTMTYDETLSYGASVNWRHAGARGSGSNTYGWKSGSRQFPHWPRTEREQTWAIYLTNEEERARGIDDSPAIRRRWVLEKGTYRIRTGERLILTRWQAADGKLFESAIEVLPEP